MLTITEALAETKTIDKRLQKKRQAILQNIARDARIKDHLEKEGGAVSFVQRERQAIADLEKRLVDIRIAIMKANLNTTIVVSSQTRTIAEWLTWRRDVSKGSKEFFTTVNQGIQTLRAKAQQSGNRAISATTEGEAKPGDIVVHLEEAALLAEMESLETILGELDGKLSLLNATTVLADL